MIKRIALVFLLVSVVCMPSVSVIRAENPPPKITLYFLIHSGACPCQQEYCRQAKPLGAFVQTHLAPGVEFKQLDYGEMPETVDPLIRQYKIFTFPAFLALDKDKQELLKIQGKMTRDSTLKKLFDQGLITGVE